MISFYLYICYYCYYLKSRVSVIFLRLRRVTKYISIPTIYLLITNPDSQKQTFVSEKKINNMHIILYKTENKSAGYLNNNYIYVFFSFFFFTYQLDT